MSINLTDEIEVKTKKGKLGAAKQIFLEGDTQTVEKEIKDINSRHNDLSSKHKSLSSTVSEHTKQIESNQSQITANKSFQDEKNTSLDANMAKLNVRDDQITETLKNITVTGGASVASAVTYDNTTSQLTSANIQGAVDELQGSKINKTSIVQESGEAEDKVMSQKTVSSKLSDLSSDFNTKVETLNYNLYNEERDITKSYINKINANCVFVSSLANVGEKYNTNLRSASNTTYYMPYLYEVSENRAYEINIKRNNLAKAFAVLDENKTVLETEDEESFSEVTAKATIFQKVITIPKGGRYLVVHTKNENDSTGGLFTGKVLTVDGDIVNARKGLTELTGKLHSRFLYYKKNEVIIYSKDISNDVAWDFNKAIKFNGEIIDSTTYKTAVTHDYIRVVPLKSYKYTITNNINDLFAACAFYDINQNLIGVNSDNLILGNNAYSLNFVVPKNAYYVKLCARTSSPLYYVFLEYTDEDYLFDFLDSSVYSYFANSGTRLRAKNVQDAISELIYERDNYIPDNNMNLCNAGMYCNLVHFTVEYPDRIVSDPLVPYTADAPSLYRNNGTCGLKVKGLAGVGRKSLTGVFYCSIPQSVKSIMGFWIKIEDFLNSDFIISDGSGWKLTCTYSNLKKDGSKFQKSNDAFDAEVIYSNCEGYSYIQVKIFKKINRITLYAPYIHNFSSFIVNDEIEGKNINPWISYKTLPEIFNSNCIGKILCYTGDSNGGGGVGSYKRLSWAARYLGMPMIGASVGGWSMQARLLNTENHSYGWLYYHKHRNKIINTNADIYYFNQCTNDGNGGNDAVFNEETRIWETTDVGNYGYTYNQKGAVTFYGRYGDGTFDEVKKVLDIYTDEFAKLLEKGNLYAEYKGESLVKICRRNFSTLACTGAFIAEIQQKQPDAMCIIDSTISSIGAANTLIGAFNASGIDSKNHLEEDGNGNLVYSPYLLSNADSEGYVMDYIKNGTINGGEAVTDITAESDLNDGKNYSLYYYYMFKQFGIDPSSVTPTQEQIDEVCRLCHAFYEERMGTSYGRCTPLNIVKMRPDLIKGSALNQKLYREGVRNLQSFLRVPFIDAGWGTCISPFNVNIIAADAGHWKENGMQKLGIIIANSLNMLFLPDTMV